MPKHRALIIGGSLGGLLAAHLLREIGWEVLVFERNSTDLVSRGAGLGTHPALMDVLRRIGIPFDDSMGLQVPKAIFLDRDGRIVAQRDTVRTMSAWGRLYRALRDPLPADGYRLDMSLQRIEQDTDAVTAVFADGSRERGDLLIGADGIRSTVREQMLPQAQPIYAGYIAWRVMLDEKDIPEKIRQDVFEHYCFCLPEGELLLGYPVPGRNNETRVGERAYNIVWYRPVEPTAALVDLCTDASGRHHPGGIPPPLIRPEVEAAIKHAAHDLVAPQIADMIGRSRPFFQPIYDLESPQIAFGRVAIIGDAAFVARPHVGAGVTKAALDAASLADAIKASGNKLDAALAHFQRQQQPFGRGVVALGRQEGIYLSAQLKPRAERKGEELNRDIESVIRDHNARRDNVKRLVAAREAFAAGSSP
jgi:2-polyprenyl-6-methoxyphenol hydroxylase-like FAD-dependent oxidoreductase